MSQQEDTIDLTSASLIDFDRRDGTASMVPLEPLPKQDLGTRYRALVSSGANKESRANILSSVSVSVIVPTLNEAPNLPTLFQRMPKEVHEVVLVDGHSTDGTVELAQELWPSIIAIQQSGKGKGNALACGSWRATGEVVVWLDADGSTDPADISRFVAALLAGADFAKGTRFSAGAGSADITRIRRAGNTALTKIVNALWGTYFTDITFGYNAFWRRHLPQISPASDGFEGEIATYLRAVRAGLSVHDVPSFEHSRHHGTSNLHARRDGVKVLRTIIAQRLLP